MRIYVVPTDAAADVRTRFDPRLHFVGSLVPDRRSRGVLTFTVPPLGAGTYAAAAWCPACARNSSGRTFFVLGIPRVSRHRERMGLRIRMPAPADSCAATIPNRGGAGRFNHGNGLLVSTLPRDGVVVAGTYEPDGSLFWKPHWLLRDPLRGTVAVRGERLDAAAPPMRVLAVRWGSGSWATASTFPTEGCWRITGRVGDVTLAYVVEVVRG